MTMQDCTLLFEGLNMSGPHRLLDSVRVPGTYLLVPGTYHFLHRVLPLSFQYSTPLGLYIGLYVIQDIVVARSHTTPPPYIRTTTTTYRLCSTVLLQIL
jgi:hypothetical protein